MGMKGTAAGEGIDGAGREQQTGSNGDAQASHL